MIVINVESLDGFVNFLKMKKIEEVFFSKMEENQLPLSRIVFSLQALKDDILFQYIEATEPFNIYDKESVEKIKQEIENREKEILEQISNFKVINANIKF